MSAMGSAKLHRNRVRVLFAAATVAGLLLGGDANAAPRKRELPDYDGRGRAPTTAADVLLWPPRVVLFPLYVTSEYVVLVSVQVDTGRVRDRLTRAGLLASDGAPAAGRVFFVLEDLHSWRPVEALTRRLRTDPGVRSVVPEEFSHGRARLAVEAAHTPDAIVKRLVAQPPEGFEVVPVRQDAEGVVLRLNDVAIDTPGPNRY